MKKRYRGVVCLVILSNLVLGSFLVNAQEFSHELDTVPEAVDVSFFDGKKIGKAALRVRGGINKPIGAFGAGNYKDRSSGFANNGAFLDVTYKYSFFKNLGGLAILKGTMNKAYWGSGPSAPSAGPGMRSNYTLSWRSIALFLGAYKEFQLFDNGSKSVHFGVSAAAGLQRTIAPSGGGTHIFGNSVSTRKYNAAFAHNFGYMGSAYFRYASNPYLSWELSISYDASRAEFDPKNPTRIGWKLGSNPTSTLDFGLGAYFPLYVKDNK